MEGKYAIDELKLTIDLKKKNNSTNNRLPNQKVRT